MVWVRVLLLLLLSAPAFAQTPSTPSPAAPSAVSAPLPPARSLLLDVEKHQAAAEALQRDYTYRVHTVLQQLAANETVRKTSTTDAQSVTLDGVRVDRVLARNGKPLSPDEAKKEDERIDKFVAKANERRAKEQGRGKETDTRGDVLIPASRILELGTFSNPRRMLLNGRSAIVLDYAGDPNAKTHGASEGIIRDLVGTVWIDEQDRVLARAEGHFTSDFKIAGGLVANIHKGFSFEFQTARVGDGVWLPSVIAGQGSARLLLFDHVAGRLRITMTDYQKFRTDVKIIPSDRVIGPDGQIIPAAPAPKPPAAPGAAAPIQPQL